MGTGCAGTGRGNAEPAAAQREDWARPAGSARGGAGQGQFTGSKCWGLASGQPPTARRALTWATSESFGSWWSVTAEMARLIASVEERRAR
jgi:hypothetical protein